MRDTNKVGSTIRLEIISGEVLKYHAYGTYFSLKNVFFDQINLVAINTCT